jgi:hypothetical protein
MAAALLTVPGSRGRLLSLMLFLVVAPACENDSPVQPPPEPTLRLLVPGEAKLLEVACTQAEPAASGGHHWCAFYRPAPDGEARTELWVVDVTRALAGEPVPCDGSSSSCIRITDRLYGFERFEGDIPNYVKAGFEGDTLLFQARENATNPTFEGATWAWRPGWSRPRPISTSKGNWCIASRSGQYAYCYDYWAEGTSSFDLRAGRLIDQDNSLLPLVERISLHAGASFSANFTRADELFVYSSWREGEAAQALRVIPAAELGHTPARTVVADVEEWVLSGDGQAVFFRRGSSPPPPSLPEGSWSWGPGSLWAADFPSGAERREIASGVMHYQPFSNTGVGFVTDPQGLQGTLHVQRDWRHPESRVRVAGDVYGWASQGRFTQIWQRDDNGRRVIVRDNERGTTCVVPIRPQLPGQNYYGVRFLPNLGALSWFEPDPTDESTYVIFLARPQDCGDVRVLGKQLGVLEEVGSHGLVFGSLPSNDSKVMSLFYVPSYDGRPLDTTGQLILSDVERSRPGWVSARRETLVMSTTGNDAFSKGVYLFGPLPPIASVSGDIP